MDLEAIKRTEDLKALRETMPRLGINMPQSELVFSVEGSERIAAKLVYPVLIRPAYALGGTGGGLGYNVEELRTVAVRRLSPSRIGQVLVEESAIGWEKL